MSDKLLLVSVSSYSLRILEWAYFAHRISTWIMEIEKIADIKPVEAAFLFIFFLHEYLIFSSFYRLPQGM